MTKKQFNSLKPGDVIREWDGDYIVVRPQGQERWYVRLAGCSCIGVAKTPSNWTLVRRAKKPVRKVCIYCSNVYGHGKKISCRWNNDHPAKKPINWADAQRIAAELVKEWRKQAVKRRKDFHRGLGNFSLSEAFRLKECANELAAAFKIKEDKK